MNRSVLARAGEFLVPPTRAFADLRLNFWVTGLALGLALVVTKAPLGASIGWMFRKRGTHPSIAVPSLQAEANNPLMRQCIASTERSPARIDTMSQSIGTIAKR